MQDPFSRTSSIALVVSLTTLLGACAPESGSGKRGTHAFTILDADSAHILPVGRQTRLNMTIRNDGREAWVPDHGFHLSYHWLSIWGAPKVRAGIWTSIVEVVPPGGKTTLDARLRMPDKLGFYRLQWDMVQEQVTWFSQVDPQPPPTWIVLIVPGVDAQFSVWPSITVLLVGLLLVASPIGARIRAIPAAFAVLAVTDVVWCTVSLLTKQTAVLGEANVVPDAGYAGVALSMSALFPVAMMLVLPTRWRPWVVWLVALIGAVVIEADLLYFRFFGDVMSASAVIAAGQTGKLGGEIRSLATTQDLWLFIDLVLAIPLVVALTQLPRPEPGGVWARRIVMAIGLIALVPAARVWIARSERGDRLDQVFRHIFVVEDYGVIWYHTRDVSEYLRSGLLRPPLSEAEFENVRDWFSRRAPSRAGTGPLFGAARGTDVIVVQVESMQRFVIGLKVGGQEVTPTLNRWMSDSLWLSRVTDQTSEGRTSDAEFVSLVSLLPLDHGAVAFHYAGNKYVGLPTVLNRNGYHSMSAVAFDPDFWNRRTIHPVYGFSDSLFTKDFSPGRQIGWGLNDRDFLIQMVPRIVRQPRPFLLWAITLSLHHPFEEFPSELKELKLGEWEDTSLGNYLHSMHYFDRAITEFVRALADQGVLSHTTLVVFGDHNAGFKWTDDMAHLLGFPNRRLEESLNDSVPVFIRVPGQNPPKGEIKTLAGQTDLAPTLLALLGIDPAPLPYMGRNILGNPEPGPLARPYGDWISNEYLLMAAGARSKRHQACYDIGEMDRVDVQRCAADDEAVRRQREVSSLVIRYDLQQRLAEAGVQGERKRTTGGPD